MKTKLYLLLFLSFFLAVSCTEDKTEPGFSIDTAEDIVIASESNSQAIIAFTSMREWTAKTDADWLSVSPSSGSAGAAEVTVTARSENTTGNVRTAVLTLTSGTLSREIVLRQVPTDYVLVEQSDYDVAKEGGKLEIEFLTNVPEDELKIYSTENDWLTQPVETRSVTAWCIRLVVSENTDAKPRTAEIVFVKDNGSKEIVLNTVTIVQQGVSASSSTDYSRDKSVRVMQTATEGNGIPIVIMGDGFIDTEIADGTYDKVMDKALENLFSEEPVKSLRAYFSVYAVTAVSENNIFGSGYKTAFSCELEGGSSTYVEGNDEVIQAYMRCVPDIDYTKTLVVVVLNSTAYAGTTFFGYTDAAGNRIEFAIAYCPVIESLDSEYFRQVLTHEAIGHGFAKLEDEYSYSGIISLEKASQVKELQELGWAQNVDLTDEPDAVLWAQFLNDSRYAAEGLGVFEGACTFELGVYRPSEDSMMNSNTVGFNAPSRKAIYDRIMKEGSEVTPTYEGFVAFDLQSNVQSRTVTRAATAPGRPFAHPRFTDKALDF